MSSDQINMYGTTWCGDCARSKRLLERLGVPYDWHNIEQDEKARAYVIEVNHGNRSVPTIVFPDGSVLVEPSDAELEKMVRAAGLK
ncbi:MAG: glutaredoxin-like protein [Chloroflexi bacterium RBG_16_57_8]|nr:MAG: glutaredoxin-like protein [Chloroflexi bacterium RBG_16_57_8]